MGFLLFGVFGYGDKQGFCAPLMSFIAAPRVLGSKQAASYMVTPRKASFCGVKFKGVAALHSVC